jgi:hypothetical protein
MGPAFYYQLHGYAFKGDKLVSEAFQGPGFPTAAQRAINENQVFIN